MSGWLLSAVTLAYCFTAAELFLSGKTGLGVTFAGYALANLGLIYEMGR